MYRALFMTASLLVAIAMALSLAHALELPGKMRLDRETYLAVQKIYYPGFTIGGAAEPAAVLALLALTWATPSGARWWWTAGALAALIVVHGIYWLVTHPVNAAWTRDIQLTGLSAIFFSAFTGDTSGDWSRLRNIWEYSHVVRSAFAMAGLACLLAAATAKS